MAKPRVGPVGNSSTRGPQQRGRRLRFRFGAAAPAVAECLGCALALIAGILNLAPRAGSFFARPHAYLPLNERMEQSVVVRFSEITLKGKNRRWFETRMAQNIAQHLRPLGDYALNRQHARMEVAGGGDLPLAMDVVSGLPGVANVSLAVKVPREPAALAEACVAYVGKLLEARGDAEAKPPTFAVAVERKDKRYPLRSNEIASLLGQAIRDRYPRLVVNLTRPDLRVQVEVLDHWALLFEEKRPGPGGLAVGSSGTAVCLMSGGIDSPVAAYHMMTRGCPVVFLNFHSFPYIGERSKEKIKDLVRFMARFQPSTRLYVAPFAAIQEAVRDACPEGMRTVMYRRMMHRVAGEVARLEGAGALLTGDELGQVASQTMENLRVILETADLPVLQPLIGMNKSQIIQVARKIGTYPISIQPFPDCCTLFQPANPDTRVRLERVHQCEAQMPIPELVAQCVAGLEISNYGPEYYPADWE